MNTILRFKRVIPFSHTNFVWEVTNGETYDSIHSILSLSSNADWRECKKSSIVLSKVPQEAGVYIFILEDIRTNKFYVAYVGSSSNLSYRLTYSHPMFRFLADGLSENYKLLVYLFFSKNFKSDEGKLIFASSPLLNADTKTLMKIQYKRKRKPKIKNAHLVD